MNETRIVCLPAVALITAALSAVSLTASAAPPTSVLTARPTASAVEVDGESVSFDAYNIGGSNYFKLRDLAFVLSGSEKQFEVTWDGTADTIALTGGKPYTPVGGEMQGKGTYNKTPVPTASRILLDGAPVHFTAYNIGGNNYFKLRDIGAAMDFGVTWDGLRNTVIIDTGAGYADALSPFYENAPGGVSPDGLPPETSQLIVVKSSGSSAGIFFLEKSPDGWFERVDCRAAGWVGRNGVSADKREGDQKTPAGQFPVGEAFYIDDPPDTNLEMFRITEDTYWVDDPGSAFYNQRVEGTKHKDWKSAEHMIRYKTNYKYGFVIGYNTECVPGLGSAVFFHVGSRGTAGCVAVSEDVMLNYLRALDREKTPYILIV